VPAAWRLWAPFVGYRFSSAAQTDDKTTMKEPSPDNAAAATPAADTVEERRRSDRRSVVDRRSGADRRSQLDRRRGPGRRRTEYRRAAEEGHMNEEQLEFLKAVDEYKRVNQRSFPTWTEVLDVVLYLGYRKVAPIGEFKLSKGRQTPLRRAAAKDQPAD
jgi:hypothetical protein